MKKKVSVIIPVFNNQKLISKCLNSIIAQSYKSLEIIVVDDGSTDSTLELCNEYYKKDNRVRIISQKNQGVSIARNNAIEKSTGEYICFVDSDDYVKDNYVEVMVKNLEENNADFVCSSCIYDKKFFRKSKLKYNYAYYDIRRLRSDYFEFFKSILHAPWGKLYKSSILKKYNIKFPAKQPYAEDLIFNLEYYSYIESAILLPDTTYYYNCKNSNSAMRRFYKNMCYYLYNVYEQKERYIENNDLIIKYGRILDDERLKYFESSLKHYISKIKEKDRLYDLIKLTVKIFYENKDIPTKYKEYIEDGNLDGVIKCIEKNKGSLAVRDIGIITINDNNNYGNRLQNYAVQETLKKCGLEVETLKNETKYNHRKNYFINRMKDCKKDVREEFDERAQRFIEFNENINFSNNYVHAFSNIKKKYKFFITGSDQVWNPQFGRLSDVDLLLFANNKQRISFSASFGISEVSFKDKLKIKKAMSKFKAISTREETGKRIIEETTKRDDIEVLVDPTMLLTVDEWDNVSKKPKQLSDEKYILNYFLGKLPDEWNQQINKFAKNNNCKIINILDKDNPFYQTGPSEFLYLEKNAFLVCTDSFHSSVFSIIYDTPFVVFERQDKLTSMNSRIDTLLSKFNLQNRRFNGEITEDLLKCDYREAKEILEKEKEKSFNFLKRALDIE